MGFVLIILIVNLWFLFCMKFKKLVLKLVNKYGVVLKFIGWRGKILILVDGVMFLEKYFLVVWFVLGLLCWLLFWRIFLMKMIWLLEIWFSVVEGCLIRSGLRWEFVGLGRSFWWFIILGLKMVLVLIICFIICMVLSVLDGF